MINEDHLPLYNVIRNKPIRLEASDDWMYCVSCIDDVIAMFLFSTSRAHMKFAIMESWGFVLDSSVGSYLPSEVTVC